MRGLVMPRLVKIVWLDARGQAGWAEDDPMYTNPAVESVGYEVGVRGQNTYLALTWDESTGKYADVSVIPTGCILAIVELQETIPNQK